MTHPRKEAVCHICGLPIPPWLINTNNPLYQTVDHVIPVSRGGDNSRANRAPAHRYCNNVKGSDYVTTELSVACRLQVINLLYLASSGKPEYFPESPRWKPVKRAIRQIRRLVAG